MGGEKNGKTRKARENVQKQGNRKESNDEKWGKGNEERRKKLEKECRDGEKDEGKKELYDRLHRVKQPLKTKNRRTSHHMQGKQAKDSPSAISSTE